MTVIVHTEHISSESASSVFSVTDDCTINIDATNDADTVVTLRISITPTSDNLEKAHVFEPRTDLPPYATFSRMGQPVKAGESIVVAASGDNINVAVRVSGYTV